MASSNGLSGGLMDFLRSPAAQAVLWVTVLMILLVVGAWVVLRFRGRATEDTAPTSDLLSNFREMHHDGHLDESEFRTIKTMLGGKIPQELNGSSPKGSVEPPQA